MNVRFIFQRKTSTPDLALPRFELLLNSEFVGVAYSEENPLNQLKGVLRSSFLGLTHNNFCGFTRFIIDDKINSRFGRANRIGVFHFCNQLSR